MPVTARNPPARGSDGSVAKPMRVTIAEIQQTSFANRGDTELSWRATKRPTPPGNFRSRLRRLNVQTTAPTTNTTNTAPSKC